VFSIRRLEGIRWRLRSRLATMRSESSGHRGLLQTQFLHSFRQILVIDLEDNLKAIIRSRKDI
jgi:hypothetical protein